MKAPDTPKNGNLERKDPFHVEVEIWGPYAMFTRPEMVVERWSYDVPTVSACRNILQTIYWHPPFQFQIKEIEVINPVKRITMTRNELDTQISSRTVKTFMDRLADRVKAALSQVAEKMNLSTGKDDETDIEKKAKKLGITLVPDLPSLKASETRQQRSSTLLKDVRYIIRADIVPSKPEIARNDQFDFNKALSIFHRRLEKGQSFTSAFMGVREYPCFIKAVDPNNRPVSAYKGTRVDLGTMLYDIDYEADKPKPYFYHPIMVDGVIKVPNEKEVMKDAARRA